MNDFSWLVDWPEHIPELLPGLGMAVFLTLVTCGAGYPLGFLLALVAESPNRVLRSAGLVIVEIGRGLPILVLLFLVYQGLPQLGITIDAVPSTLVAFIWSAAAYSAEIIRASVAAVPRGQFEASLAVSLSPMDMYRFVVLPQAARISLPPLVSLTIVMFHATSLASVITVPEIMDAAHFVGSNTFQYMSVYVAAAVLYAVIAIPGALLAHQLERRLGTPTSLTRTLFRQTPKKTAAM